MHIAVLGINYKSAEICIREFVSRACRKRLSGESEVAEMLHCVILSTCNRTEIYFCAENLAEAHSQLLHVLREEVPIAFEHKLYSYFGIDCFMHLAHVTSGLDSAIIAESEIQRQVKVAYQHTLLHYRLPSCMHYLFQKCLKLGKGVRSEVPLTDTQVSVPKTLFQISSHLMKDLDALPILFIGNSEINRKVIAYFKRRGVHQLSLCTRSLYSAKEMAEKDHLTLLSWEQLPKWQEYPLVICGTNASGYVIETPAHALRTRLIFDLSMPRKVNPALAGHPQIVLLNIQELSELIESEQKKNRLEIDRAEELIASSVQRYIHSYRQKEERAHLCALS